jgi:hypothetical protein
VGAVRSAMFSPDGERIVSFDQTCVCGMQKQDRGRIVGPFVGSSGAIRAVAYSPNDRQIVSRQNYPYMERRNGRTGY